MQLAENSFGKPVSEAYDPFNLLLACKVCTILVLGDPCTETFASYLSCGRSANDVIQVSAQIFKFIVKVPRDISVANAAFNCKAEAMRTAWAALRDIGPRVLCIDPESGGFAMEKLEGHTLTVGMIKSRLPQIVRLLRKIHAAEPAKLMWKYDPMAAVTNQLHAVKAAKAMKPQEIKLIEDIISNTARTVKDHPWVLCHNDFHSHNIFLQPAKTGCCSEKLMAIDFEECDLGDPMCDLAYLIVNLGMERAQSSWRCYMTSL